MPFRICALLCFGSDNSIVDVDIAPWIKGAGIALLMSIPVMIIVFSKERKAIIPMSIFSLILGAGIGIVGAIFIG